MKNVTPMPQQQRTQINVDLDKLADVVCLKCGNKEFIQVTHLKRLTKLISPNGQEGIINANMLKCNNPECGKFFDPNEYQRWEMQQEQEKLKALEVKERAAFQDNAQADDPDTKMCRNCGATHSIHTECPECSGVKKED